MTYKENPRQPTPQIPGRRLSGRGLVLLMFGFAVLLTGAMGLYWHYYTLPFRPLQNAINAAYPDSSPRAIGGRLKGHSDEPMTLRVVVRSEFDPTVDIEQSEVMAHRLFELAREHTAIDEYEVFEVYLYELLPEQENPTWTASRPVSEWAAATPE